MAMSKWIFIGPDTDTGVQATETFINFKSGTNTTVVDVMDT